eukprot:CAMPEP_0173172888 /NCGR_PEP_ID=MMETSP1141-20130122/2545_1 /TAXON_ID=483371 /ORGANISM="non described non described, Strain CCMP2298" /LENGTH=111 /DNA_ID=CAMNT_0014094947 /DNA_START=251 /DNA_END=587 /DNA_ORIENTATION=+
MAVAGTVLETAPAGLDPATAPAAPPPQEAPSVSPAANAHAPPPLEILLRIQAPAVARPYPARSTGPLACGGPGHEALCKGGAVGGGVEGELLEEACVHYVRYVAYSDGGLG